MGPKAWGWTATIDLEGHKAISVKKQRNEENRRMREREEREEVEG